MNKLNFADWRFFFVCGNKHLQLERTEISLRHQVQYFSFPEEVARMKELTYNAIMTTYCWWLTSSRPVSIWFGFPPLFRYPERFVDHEYLRILAKHSADKRRPQLVQSVISILRIWSSVVSSLFLLLLRLKPEQVDLGMHVSVISNH